MGIEFYLRIVDKYVPSYKQIGTHIIVYAGVQLQTECLAC
jgi:hypothetical protein